MTEINYLHASISTSLHIVINCLLWIWGLLVSMLRWKIWGRGGTVKVGGAGEESGGSTGEEVAGASEDVGGSVGKEIGGGDDNSDKEVEGGGDVSLDAVLPLCAGCPRVLFLLCWMCAAQSSQGALDPSTLRLSSIGPLMNRQGLGGGGRGQERSGRSRVRLEHGIHGGETFPLNAKCHPVSNGLETTPKRFVPREQG